MFDLNTFTSLESFLGDSNDENNLFSFEAILQLDKKEKYPAEQVEALNTWRLNDYFIIESDGGRLRNLHDLLFLMRLVARRDLTTAIAYGGTFLGAITIWIGGSPALKESAMTHIRNGKKIAFALTERKRGSDLLAGDTYASYNSDTNEFELNGEKWLYNHASKSNFATLLVKTTDQTGPRSCSLFYVASLLERERENITSIKTLDRIHTVGLKGLDIGGIRLDRHIVREGAMIGKPGSGLELALAGLQVTKALCTSLSLGSLDTLLRCTVQFCQERILYKRPVLEIPIVRSKLRNAFLDLIMAESLSLTACRTAQVFPSQFGLISSIIKASIPTLVEHHTKELASLLGARSYINSETEYKIFQKQARDNSIISIFEGSTYVNYQYALQQMKIVFSLLSSPGAASGETLKKVYHLRADIPYVDFAKLSVVGKGKDDLMFGLKYLLEDFRQLKDDHIMPAEIQEIKRDIEYLIQKLDVLREEFIQENPTVNNPFVIEAKTFNYAYDYTKLHAISAAACIIFYNRDQLNSIFSWSKLLSLCLRKISSELKREFFLVSSNDEDLVLRYILHCYRESFLFSLFPLKVL